MPSVDYPDPVKVLIQQLKQLPGIGPRSAERIAVWLLQQGTGCADGLAEAVQHAGHAIVECPVCGFFSTREDGCAICDDPARDRSVVCVVEQPTDILPMERSGAFRGQYHSLRGRLSPLEDIGPDKLRLRELVSRVAADGEVAEVILGLSSDVEGEATSNYLVEVLQAFPQVKVSRLAQGLPAGGGLGSADDLTLMRALQGRVSV